MLGDLIHPKTSKKSKDIKRYPKHSKNIKRHQKISKDIQKHSKTSKDIKKHPKTSKDIHIHPKTPKDIQIHYVLEMLGHLIHLPANLLNVAISDPEDRISILFNIFCLCIIIGITKLAYPGTSIQCTKYWVVSLFFFSNAHIAVNFALHHSNI